MNLIIHPDSYKYSHDGPYFAESGTVEVTINGDTRRIGCIKSCDDIILHRTWGRIERGRKWWPLRAALRDGTLCIEVYESGMSHYDSKTWAELAFDHP